MSINLVRVINNQIYNRSILLDKIDMSQGNFEGYAQHPKQAIYVPYSNPKDPSVKGYLDLIPTDEVLLRANIGFGSFLTTLAINSSLIATPVVTSGSNAGANTTLGGTTFLSISPDITKVVLKNLVGVTQTVLQAAFTAHTAIQIVIPDAVVTIGAPAVGWTAKVFSNSKYSNEFTLT
jgi:hypothetical protein